jgi:choline dehydrogenase-like flavoprotein
MLSTSKPPLSLSLLTPHSGGTSGSVVAARLASDPNISVLLIEAGQHSSLVEFTRMCGAWKQGFDTQHDWNITTEPCPGANNRCVKVSRGRYLSGCTGCNGTLCVRGVKQDYDNWGLPGWRGDEFWGYMTKVCPHVCTTVADDLKAKRCRRRLFIRRNGSNMMRKTTGPMGRCIQHLLMLPQLHTCC